MNTNTKATAMNQARFNKALHELITKADGAQVRHALLQLAGTYHAILEMNHTTGSVALRNDTLIVVFPDEPKPLKGTIGDPTPV